MSLGRLQRRARGLAVGLDRLDLSAFGEQAPDLLGHVGSGVDLEFLGGHAHALCQVGDLRLQSSDAVSSPADGTKWSRSLLGVEDDIVVPPHRWS